MTASEYDQPATRVWTKSDDTETLYQVVIGPGTIFGGRKIPSLVDITKADGASHTLLVVEAVESVPWTKPADLEITPDQPLPPLGGLYRNLGWRPFAGGNLNIVQAAFADGHVQSVSKDWMKSNIRALATWNGGEAVELP